MNRSQSLSRGRKPKRTQPKREWTAARSKVEAEGCCRVCGAVQRVEAAHVLGREHDAFWPLSGLLAVGERVRWPEGRLHVHPDRIVPLCGPATDTGTCHGKQHAHTLDLLPYLTIREQLQAVADAGGIALALRRISGRNYSTEGRAA